MGERLCKQISGRNEQNDGFNGVEFTEFEIRNS